MPNRSPLRPQLMAQFSDLPLATALLDAVEALGYHSMTRVQAAALPPILAGEDLLVLAETGSGKTATYGLGLLSRLDTEPRVQGLVICPTRELAEQVAAEIRRLAHRTPNVRVSTVTGGTRFDLQKRALQRGAHVVVGTPGRLDEHARKQSLDLERVRVLVLDEVDRLHQMGFEETLTRLLAGVPRDRQTLLLSATYPASVERLSERHQHTTVRRLEVEPEARDADVDHDREARGGSVEELFCRLEASQLRLGLVRWLGHLRPTSALVFCATREECDGVTGALRAAGWCAAKLHGAMPQEERAHSLLLLRSRALSVLVSTDVAARGWDVEGLQLVVNLGLPNHAHIYQHRVGRTGRAGASGRALTLITARCEQEGRLAKLEAARGEPVEWSSLPEVDSLPLPPPPFGLLVVNAGKSRKLRPGDLLGALTAGDNVASEDVGTITISNRVSHVAVRRARLDAALRQLSAGPVKGRKVKARLAGLSAREPEPTGAEPARAEAGENARRLG